MKPQSSTQLPGDSITRKLAETLGTTAVTDRAIDRYGIAHDASHYLVIPQSVVRPTSVEDIAQLFKVCTFSNTPLTFRSGGTSLSGQAQSESLLVDTRHAFTGVQVWDSGKRVRVKPGTTVGTVNAHLRGYGYRLGPDPASEQACTVGGVVANNSSGMQCGTKENTYATLESLVFILPSGTIIDSGDPGASRLFAEKEPRIHQGLIDLRRRIMDNPALVKNLKQQFSLKNTMGYGLNSFIDFEDPLDIFVHLLIGSEGTLGFIAEATFRTVPVLPYQATGLLVFPDLQSATSAVPDLLETGTATAELLDAASLRVSALLSNAPPSIQNLQVTTHAALLVEYQALTDQELQEQINAAAPALAGLNLTSPYSLTSDGAERDSLWSTRKGLYSAVAWARPQGTNALLEDIAVPIERLAHTCTELSSLFAQYNYPDSVIFGHARDGNIHFLVNERFDDDAALTRYESFTNDFVDLVLSESGTLKAEHGTGRVMAPFVERQYGTELYQVMKDLKALVDPAMILNPMSVLSDDPTSYLQNLKTAEPVEEEVDRCVECGYCEPVCPSRNLTTTPRQRIVLRRAIARAEAQGDEELAKELREDYQYEGIETCAVDGMCAAACPVQINTGDLVRRLRAENSSVISQRGWNLAARSWKPVSRGGAVALTLASALPPPLPTGVTKVGRAILGDDAVPLYDAGLPRGGKPRARINEPDAQAVIFSSCVGSMFGPQADGIGVNQAFLTLCGRAGIPVRTAVQPDSLCCGTPWSSKGKTRGYESMQAKVETALREATDDGRLPVVVDASSCTQGLTKLLSSTSFAHPISIIDATVFVAQEVLPRLGRVSKLPSLMLHPTCSSTQLGINSALKECAEFIAEEVAEPIEWGCCGFAGDRGLLHPELTASATASEAAEVNQKDYFAYASSNRTCEVGLTRATGQEYQNILELVEIATR